jgi:hypothetical protein
VPGIWLITEYRAKDKTDVYRELAVYIWSVKYLSILNYHFERLYLNSSSKPFLDI